MRRYVVISVVSGILFGILDGLINANPLAQRLLAVYQSIAKTTLNLPAGMVIDLTYGFILAGIFLLLYRSLPGKSGLVKGISFALLVWFFRTAMSVISNWMMFTVPAAALLYLLLAGLAEQLVLGILYGLTLKPAAGQLRTNA